jgi:drug/metabolite transporter (DMT)-like permease
MGETLALLGALAFAFGTVLQQKGTLSTDAVEGDPRFLVQVLHQPVWLAGAGAQAIGWVLQAMALDRASLTAVQALTALSLVIALPLGVWLTHQAIGKREVTGALLTMVGIVIFLSAGQPQGGSDDGSATAFRFFEGSAKALVLGSAAGLGFGLQAAVTKTFVTQVGNGVVALLGTWSVYVLVLSALSGFVLQQSALKTGVLAPAMASSNSVTLFASVVMGVTIYGERLSKAGGAHVGAAVVGLAVAIVGIAFLAGSEPPDEVATEPSLRSS